MDIVGSGGSGDSEDIADRITTTVGQERLTLRGGWEDDVDTTQGVGS